MLENNLTKDETLGNYERQYWNLHQSHGRPWDPLSEQVLTAHSESSQDYHRCLELHPMMSLLLWIGANISSAPHSICGCHLRKVFEFCSSCLRICKFRSWAGGHWAPMGGCLCGSFSRVSSIWVRGLLSW